MVIRQVVNKQETTNNGHQFVKDIRLQFTCRPLLIDFSAHLEYGFCVTDEQCGDQLVTLSSTNNSVKPMIIYIQPYKCPVPGAPQHWTKCCDPPSHNCCKISTDTMSIFDINQT
ncbi:hypothetical protein T4D_8257 [Trichinella pseudospiralis]|uniref:Uncharacterized protein n=1 Tax=Trichinella pseudospiralis TaxID=6337 RepID=A0A0V1FTW4_TRIPS|nr:hypothetical protein T4D_8257 [Trichinella pseudospiralis]